MCVSICVALSRDLAVTEYQIKKNLTVFTEIFEMLFTFWTYSVIFSVSSMCLVTESDGDVTVTKLAVTMTNLTALFCILLYHFF